MSIELYPKLHSSQHIRGIIFWKKREYFPEYSINFIFLISVQLVYLCLGPRQFTNTTCKKYNSCKQVILTDILVYIDSRTDKLYYYTQLVLMNCTSVYTTHINGIHTHTDIALYIYRFLYRYTVLLCTSCTDELYFCVNNYTLMYNLTLPKHTLVVHTLCSDQLYCCMFIL
jgi:hypothetical protein